MNDDSSVPVEKIAEVQESKGVDKIPVDLFIKDASHNVSVQGMLADKAELRDALLSDAEWEAALTSYNKKRIA